MAEFNPQGRNISPDILLASSLLTSPSRRLVNILILQLKVPDQFFSDLFFYAPLPKGGRIKNLNSNLVQNFCFKYLGKVKKL